MASNLVRSFFGAATLLAAAGGISVAHASPVSFDLTLTPLFGKTPDGTGSFILDGTKVEDLSLTVDGFTFDDFTGVHAIFNKKGTLIGLSGTDIGKGDAFAFDFFGNNDFGGVLALFGDDKGWKFGDDGKIIQFDIALADPPPDPAPLPPAWTMMLAGILGLFIFWRRPKRISALTAS